MKSCRRISNADRRPRDVSWEKIDKMKKKKLNNNIVTKKAHTAIHTILNKLLYKYETTYGTRNVLPRRNEKKFNKKYYVIKILYRGKYNEMAHL